MTDEIIHSELQEDFQAMRTENLEEIEQEIDTKKQTEPRPGQLESIGTEIGLEEVDLDPETLNTVTVDDTNDNLDIDDDGIEEDIVNKETISDLAKGEALRDRPTELTQSYGTGLEGKPTDRAGTYSRRQDFNEVNEDDAILTGGDIDDDQEQAATVGDEAVGGTAATPDQDIVDNLGKAVGLEMSDRASVRTNDILEKRDDNRWELDPQSSDDYKQRQDD